MKNRYHGNSLNRFICLCVCGDDKAVVVFTCLTMIINKTADLKCVAIVVMTEKSCQRRHLEIIASVIHLDSVAVIIFLIKAMYVTIDSIVIRNKIIFVHRRKQFKVFLEIDVVVLEVD